jgi:ATP-binding cassette subfamily C (CFTR/MRP) protein 1
LEIGLLVLWIITSAPKTRLTIATGALTAGSCVIFTLLSYFEHTRSIGPSQILQIFLFLSTLLDAPRVRTMWSIQDNFLIAVLFSASVASKIPLLFLESAGKRSLLRPMYIDSSLESTSGIFSQSLFLWMNIQLSAGYKNVLSMADLLRIDESLFSRDLEDSGLQIRWNKSTCIELNTPSPSKLITEPVSKTSPGSALLLASIQQFKWAIAAGVLPRVCQIGFMFAQPFLVERTVLLMSEPDSPITTYTGYGLIAAFGIVYMGIAVCLTPRNSAKFSNIHYRSPLPLLSTRSIESLP